jgi:hypothetical protein
LHATFHIMLWPWRLCCIQRFVKFVYTCLINKNLQAPVRPKEMFHIMLFAARSQFPIMIFLINFLHDWKKKTFWAKLIFYWSLISPIFVIFMHHMKGESFFFLVKTREIEYKINEDGWLLLGWAKKLKKPIKQRKPEKNNRTVKKTD